MNNNISIDKVKNIAADIISEKNDLNKINTLIQILMKENEQKYQEAVLGYTRKVFKTIILVKKLIQFKNYSTFEIQNIEIEDNFSKQKKEQIRDQNQIQEFISQKFQAFVQVLLTATFNRDVQEELRIVNLRTLIELSRYHFKNVELIYSEDNNIPLLQKNEIIIQKITDLQIKSYAQSNAGEFVSVILEYLNQYYDFTLIYLVCLTKSVQKCITKKKKNSNLDEVQQEIQEEELTTQKMILIENITSIIQDIPKFSTLKLEEIFYFQEEKKQVKKAGNFKQSEELKKILEKRKNPFVKEDKERKEDNKQEKQNKILNDLQSQFSEFIFNTIDVIQGYPDSEIIFANHVVDYVLGNMQNPLLISDYYTKVFDEAIDCNLQILSLHCILRLIGEFGLEYPNFYQKLYSLIAISDIFKCEQSPKFMKMIELVLKSQQVSLTVQASFIRRFAIVSLTQPPNTILWILSIITNTLKRNPTLTKMIDVRDLNEGIEDVFDPSETDIYNTQAEDSYIWEIQTLKNHYLNEVNKLINVMGSNLAITNYLETEPFSDLKYSDLIHLTFDVAQNKKQRFEVKQNVSQSSEVQALNLELFQ